MILVADIADGRYIKWIAFRIKNRTGLLRRNIISAPDEIMNWPRE